MIKIKKEGKYNERRTLMVRAYSFKLLVFLYKLIANSGILIDYLLDGEFRY